MTSGGRTPRRLSDTTRLRTTRIGLVGFGAVGCEVARILIEESAHLTRKTGRYLRLARVVDTDAVRPRAVELSEGVFTNQLSDMLDDDEIPVVAVLVGEVEEENRIVRQLIASGKSVVSASAGLLAMYGTELIQLARERGVSLSFGASVGEGLPLVSLLRDELVANDIHAIYGILNVTANFVLTAMERDGLPLDEALVEVERLGYSEPDPMEDVGGHDAAHKLAILANLCFSGRVDLADIYHEGIEDLSPRDLELSATLGYRIRLLALGVWGEEALDLRVHPTLIPVDHPLAGVEGARCALYCVSNCSGPLLFSGYAAGAGPTAAAVVADLVNVALKREEQIFKHAEMFPIAPKSTVRDVVSRFGRYYLSFDGVVGQEEMQEICNRCDEQGIVVEATALCENLGGLIVGPVEEDKILAFAGSQSGSRGVQHKLLRVSDLVG